MKGNAMKGKAAKGQFFIVGAVLICSLFFIGLPRFSPVIKQASGDLTFISSNLRSELPHAFNLGLNESEMLGHMEGFTHFLERVMGERNINYTSMWLIIRNQSGTDLNITAGNFLGEDTIVTITISDGNPGRSAMGLQLLNGTFNDTVFTSVDPSYNISISFTGQEETAEFVRDKASIYAFFRLTRSDDVIQNHVFG